MSGPIDPVCHCGSLLSEHDEWTGHDFVQMDEPAEPNTRATEDALRAQRDEAVRLLRGARKWLDRVHVEQREEIDDFLEHVKGVEK